MGGMGVKGATGKRVGSEHEVTTHLRGRRDAQRRCVCGGRGGGGGFDLNLFLTWILISCILLGVVVTLCWHRVSTSFQ